MSDAVSTLIAYLESNIGVMFEEKCVKNDAFNQLGRVKKSLAKAAITQCWDKVSLEYIDEVYGEVYGEDVTNDLAHVVYETTLAK